MFLLLGVPVVDMCVHVFASPFLPPSRYHYNVANSRVEQHVEKGNDDGLAISSVGCCQELWALIMDAGTGFTAQVYNLTTQFLPKVSPSSSKVEVACPLAPYTVQVPRLQQTRTGPPYDVTGRSMIPATMSLVWTASKKPVKPLDLTHVAEESYSRPCHLL